MIRQLLYFVVGLLLGATVVLAHADTYSASLKWRYGNQSVYNYSTGQEAADAAAATYTVQNGYTKLSGSYSNSTCSTTAFAHGTVVFVNSTYNANPTIKQCWSTGLQVYSVYQCLNGGSLSGSTCTKSCNPGETLQADGTCLSSTPCSTYPPATADSLPATQPSNCACPPGTSWYAYNGCRKTCGGNQPTGEVANSGFGIAIADGATEGCFQGCLVQHKAGGYDQYKGYKMATATWSKWACNGNGLGTGPTPNDQPTPDAQTQDPSKKKDPPCAAGDGVITSSSGGVKCLPEGTPNTSKPSVEKKTKTETFPDNSTKTTTETTTRDPNTNATSVSTTTTSTGGQSGPAGTSTSQEGTTGKVGGGNGNGDGDGSCDPTLNFCGGPSTDDLYKKKDKTMESVLGKFKDDVANTEFAKGAGAFFNVTIPGGSCGGMSANVPYLNMTVDLGQFLCTQQAAQLLEGVGAVLRVVVAFLAFTCAFL